MNLILTYTSDNKTEIRCDERLLRSLRAHSPSVMCLSYVLCHDRYIQHFNNHCPHHFHQNRCRTTRISAMPSRPPTEVEEDVDD